MGKARTPGAPGTCGRWRCSLPGCRCAWWGCVTAGPGWPAGRRRPSGRARWPAGGCPLALGQDLVRHALFRYQTRASLPRAYFARAEAALGDGYVYLVLAQSKSPAGGGHRPVHPPGLQPHLPGPGRGPGHPGQLQRRGRDRLPRPEPGDRPRPGPPGGGLPAGLPPARHPAPEADHPPPPGEDQPGGQCLQPAGPPLFPVAWQPNQMFCSQFVYRMPRLAGLHYFRKDPFQVRPMDFVDLDAQGALTLVAAYTRVGGRLLAWEARPLPAGWQASA